ncbi:MAG: hypothetical protein ACE3JP_03705 [Ectobacillus sp.]
MPELSSYTVPVFIFYIIHAVLVFMVVRMRGEKKKPRRGVYQWIGLISICVPIIGTLLGYAAFLASKWFVKETVHSYEKYIDFQFANYEEVTVEAKEDIELMPFVSGLELQNSSVHKDLIIQLMEAEVKNPGKYLERALGSFDAETVHYAATTLNHLKEHYEKLVEEQTGQLSAIEPQSYLLLCDTYKQYLESNIVNGFMEEQLYKQYEKVAEEAAVYFPHCLPFLDHLVSIYKRFQKDGQALNMAKTMMHRFPSRYEGYVRVMELYFEKGNISHLPRIYEAFVTHADQQQIPPPLEPVLQQVRSMLT